MSKRIVIFNLQIGSMKTILLLVLSLFTFSTFAQFSIDTDSVYVLYDTNEPEITAYNVHSTTNPTVTLRWEVVSVDVPSTWENDFFICDAVQCWDSTVNTNTYDLPDNKDYPLDCHFLNNGAIGEGKAKIRIWEVGDSANTVQTVTYLAKVEEAVGIKSVSKINVSVFPNPASNTIQVRNIDKQRITKLEIYSIIGRKVKEQISLNNNENLNISGLESGVYILVLTDSSGKKYSLNFTKK